MENNNNNNNQNVNNNNKNVVSQYGSTISSSSSSSFDYLFGSRYPSTSSSSSTSGSFLSTIFPPNETALARDYQRTYDLGGSKYEKTENFSQDKKGESSGVTSRDSKYQTEKSEPYYSSSIHYGGQENYSPATRTTHESQKYFRKDHGNDDDSNDNNPNSASRGNWWQGSLYY